MRLTSTAPQRAGAGLRSFGLHSRGGSVKVGPMRWLILASLVLACGGTAGPTTVKSGTIPASTDDAAAKAKVHEFFAAFDSNDPQAFRALTTDGFFMFQFGFAIERERFLQSKRLPRTRSCDDESIRRTGGTIVYTGDCLEQKPPEGDEPAAEFPGWNTVVLVREGDAWKAALWNWTYGGIETEKARWDMNYRTGIGFSKAPNRFLSETITKVAPGRALVLAMGQGRNALHLASKGWKVSGVDMSDEGTRKARAAAGDAGLEIDAVLANVDEYDFGTNQWDLVTMMYAGSSADWLERIVTSMRPGGLFVLEHFERPAGVDDREQGASLGDLTPIFKDWEILVSQSVEDMPDWGKQKARMVRFVARKPKP